MPVTDDKDSREIIRQGLGFDVKHAALMEQLEPLMGNTGPCHLNAKFTFKSEELKQKFIDILNGKDGLSLTRSWTGCESIECFVSQENSLEFTESLNESNGKAIRLNRCIKINEKTMLRKDEARKEEKYNFSFL